MKIPHTDNNSLWKGADNDINPKKISEPKKNCLSPKKVVISFEILQIHSFTRSLELTWLNSLADGSNRHTDKHTDIATYRLNWPRGRCSEKV